MLTCNLKAHFCTHTLFFNSCSVAASALQEYVLIDCLGGIVYKHTYLLLIPYRDQTGIRHQQSRKVVCS